MKIALFALAFLFLAGVAFAATCPAGAASCFYCGVNGTPCDRNGAGVWDPVLKQNIVCKLPQGEEPTCYAPYAGTAAQIISSSAACAPRSPACASDASTKWKCGLLIREGLLIRRAGTSEWCHTTSAVWLAPGDTLWVPEGTDDVGITYQTGEGTDAYGNHYDDREGGKFAIKQNTILKIRDVTYTRNLTQFIFAIFKGATCSYITGRQSIYRIETPTACTGTRGTVYTMESNGTQVTTQVFEGEVWFEAGGRNITLEPGQSGTLDVATNQLSGPTSFDVDSADKWWENVVGGGGTGGCGSALILLGLPLLLAFAIRR